MALRRIVLSADCLTGLTNHLTCTRSFLVSSNAGFRHITGSVLDLFRTITEVVVLPGECPALGQGDLAIVWLRPAVLALLSVAHITR